MSQPLATRMLELDPKSQDIGKAEVEKRRGGEGGSVSSHYRQCSLTSAVLDF